MTGGTDTANVDVPGPATTAEGFASADGPTGDDTTLRFARRWLWVAADGAPA